jgi:hypothetical protein
MTLLEFLKENGYNPVEHSKAQFGEHGIACQHKVGLPTGDHILQLKPSYNPTDGTRTILVTNDSVSSYVCKTPYLHSNWRCTESRTYRSPEELNKHLNEMLNPPQGCWK